MKEVTSSTVIGGADGPTSIFLAGKGRDKNIFRRIRNDCRTKRYQGRRRKAEKSIVPGVHSMMELAQYMKEKYGAVEMDTREEAFQKRRNQMKYSLLRQERPDLVGEEDMPPSPENMEDADAVREWFGKLAEMEKRGEEIAAALPEEVFPVDYHIYCIDLGDSHMEIETESGRGLLGASASGSQKQFQAVMKDIYLYYGVTQKDIEEKTDRYHRLVTELSM